MGMREARATAHRKGHDEMKKLPRVLVVEDEPAIAELIAVNLRHNGFAPTVVFDGQAAQREVDAVLPDVILLDWMLPGESGATLARAWRKHERTKTVPILMLTARSDEADKVQGLDAGADDYITKPFSTQELLARIRAVLRRRAPEIVNDSVQVGELSLDAGTYRTTFQGQELKLGPTEFKLLHYLMKHAERVHTRGTLLDKIWGDHVFIEERTVDVHVKRLRESLGEAASMVETVRGRGLPADRHQHRWTIRRRVHPFRQHDPSRCRVAAPDRAGSGVGMVARLGQLELRRRSRRALWSGRPLMVCAPGACWPGCHGAKFPGPRRCRACGVRFWSAAAS